MLNLWFKLDDKIRFLFVGGFNFLVAYLIYSFLCIIGGAETYQVALAIAWILSSVVSFVTQKIFVFEAKGNWLKEYFKCCTTWFFSYLINAALLEFCVKYLLLNVFISQLIANFLAAIFTYIMFKKFAFKKRKE